MIPSELKVVKREDTDRREVRDSDGNKVVCVTSVKNSNQVYHEIDTCEFEKTGTVVSRCSEQFEHGGMKPVRVEDLADHFRACRWHQCGGDHMRTTISGSPNGSKQLRTILDRMTVDQFDRIVAEYKSGGLNGESH